MPIDQLNSNLPARELFRILKSPMDDHNSFQITIDHELRVLLILWTFLLGVRWEKILSFIGKVLPNTIIQALVQS